MRPALIKGTRKYLEGNLEKHKMNAEMLFERGAAVAEHPGYLETIEQELANIAEYSDKLAVLYEHFEKLPTFFDDNCSNFLFCLSL